MREDIYNYFNNELSSRNKVNYLEQLMQEQPQLNLEVKHYFSLGIYGRELFIPKGTLLTGHIHKYPQMNVMLKGHMSVLVGEQIETVYAPFIVCSPADTKRIAYAHEDTIWLTIHATNEINVSKIEEQFIAKSEQEFIDFVNEQKKLPLFDRD